MPVASKANLKSSSASFLSSSATVYVCGDKDFLAMILKGFTHYGSLARQGFGKVESVKIETIEDDLSLKSAEGKANRFLPVDLFDCIEKDKIAICRCIYPYYSREGEQVPCYI